MPFHFADSSADSHHFVESAYVRAPKEVACALAASLLISPMISVIDKTIVKRITGVGSLLNTIGAESVAALRNPRKFTGALAFRLTVVVYFGTYAVANLSELGLDEFKVAKEDKRKQIKVSFAATANIALLAWRDTIFAREFSSGPPKATPLRMISMFALRDFGTMGATFYGAPKAAKYLIKEHDVHKEVADLGMALAVPITCQYITAPLHIHAMDFYNRPIATTQERIRTIVAEYNKVAFARALRIIPAFGIGSYANNKMRETFIKQPDLSMYWTRRVTRLVQRATRAVKPIVSDDSAPKKD